MGLVDPGINIREENEMTDIMSNTLYTLISAIPELEKTEREELFRGLFIDIFGATVIDKMIDEGFCEKPASTKYHGNHEGGLLQHSIAVAYYLTLYTEKLGLDWERENSPIIIGILHDLCKIDSYRRDECGEDTWVYSHSTLIDGHSQKSVIYSQMYGMTLTEEEILCIVNHMGSYETNRWNEYDRAVKMNKNVLYTHMADVAASKILGV